MEFSSSRQYAHDATDIWDIVADFRELTSIFPQVTAYEEIGDNRVRITVKLDFGKFSGTYYADFTIHDLSRPKSIRIDGVHKSGIGGMELFMTAFISPAENETHKLELSGSFKRSGLVSWASKSIIRNGIDFALKYMFDLVDQRLERLQIFKSFSEEE